MRKEVLTWSLLGALLTILAGVLCLGQSEARLVGLVIWRDDQRPPEIHCRFLYKGSGQGFRRVDADEFCQANLQAVRQLGKVAFDFAEANPIPDAGTAKHHQNLRQELEAAGYTVTPP